MYSPRINKYAIYNVRGKQVATVWGIDGFDAMKWLTSTGRENVAKAILI